MTGNLKGKVAIVGGASRGASRGIALALGEAGATVYVAARSTRGGWRPPDEAPGTIEETAEQVNERGGHGIPVRTDCTMEADVAALFEQVEREQGRLDIVASGIFEGVNFMQGWGKPFWQQPVSDWRDGMAGATALYLLARGAARLMSKQRAGLIVGVTDMIVDEKEPRGYCGHLMMDLGHETINRLMFDMSAELRKHNVAVVTMMPGFMRTERVMRAMTSDALKKQFGFERSETPEYLGRAVAALAQDPKGAMARTGRIVFVADVARQYGFTDVDGKVIPRFHA